MQRRQFIAFLGIAAVTRTLAARAQQPVPVIGFLSSRSSNDSASVEAAFRAGLRETGFTVGQNVQIIYGWAGGQFDRLPSLAAELVERRVSAIVAVGGDATADAAKEATTTIPIVFITGTDPAKTGLVKNFNKPESNVTGVTLFSTAVEQKRLELLHTLLPNATTFAMLINPKKKYSGVERDEMESAAKTLGERVSLRVLNASTTGDIEVAFEAIARSKIEALLVGTDSFFSTERKLILRLTERHQVPAIYDSRVQVEEGGLISYGSVYADVYRQAGTYAGRILKGARPADLPVLLPTKFELFINLKTAKALGLTIPPGVLAIADEVIE
jgi:putative ABC transport system substrate-binding protein